MIAIMMGIIMIAFFLYIGRKEIKSAIENEIKNPTNDIDDKVIIPILLFLITILLIYIIVLNLPFVREIIFESKYPTYDKLVLFITSITISIFINVMFSGWIQKIYEKKAIREYEKKHTSKEYEYYRDILQEKSPTILSYCYNKKIDIKDNVVAILLNLQMQNVIEIKGNTIKVVDDTSILKKHEEFVLKQIQKPRYDENSFKEEFEELLIKDLKKENYLKEKGKKFKANSFFESIMVLLLLYLLVTIPIWMEASSIGVVAFLAYFFNFCGMFQYKKIQNRQSFIVRTEKALELAGKLKGLKRYIENYSMIKDNGIENINLYNEYIIYAIIFDIKGKLNNECRQIYKDTKDMIINNNRSN